VLRAAGMPHHRAKCPRMAQIVTRRVNRCGALLSKRVPFPAKLSGCLLTAGARTRSVPTFAPGVVVTPRETTRDALPVL
jgi:hypothetical protein